MPKIILITHQKGGVGKSTITYNLANTFALDSKTAICDFDLQGSLINSKEYSNVPVYSADDFKKLLKSDYDFIFVDTPPYITNKISELVNLSDVIIIPTKVGFYDFLAISETTEIIKKNKKDRDALIVFNMVKNNTSLTAEMQEVIKGFDIPLAKTYLSDLVSFTRSGVKGVPINDKARNQIDDLAMEILNILAK